MDKSRKGSFARFVGLSLVAISMVVPLSASAVSTSCTSADTVMYVVAHQDDQLLFQNPDLQRDISLGRCVTQVIMTAGEAGRDSTYWLAREAGTKAATAFMAGVANSWTESDAGIPGHAVPKFTLDANPKVTFVFFRLPDGGVDGGTFNGEGLQKLWQGDIASITSKDGQNTYTKDGLVDALLSLMTSMNPSRINAHEFIGVFNDGDHSDHVASGYFVKSAHLRYNTLHVLYGYVGYHSQFMAENVFGDDLLSNKNTFFTYTPFDSDACQSVEACAGPYLNWLSRQYTNGSEEGGDMCPNIDGRQVVVPEGYDLSEGQCVQMQRACETDVTTASFVSDTTSTVSTGGNAVLTYVPPTWTANIPGASWIWNAYYVSDPVNGETLTFTKEITVDGTPTAGSIVFATDDNFDASLNGTQFALVPEISNFNAGNEDTFDVSSLLHSGVNTLSVTVHNIPMGVTDPEINPAGLLFKMDVTKNSCGSEGGTDLCANLDGVQTSVPGGMTRDNGQCVASPVTPSGNSGGGSTNFDYWGCTNTNATNFNRLANKDDGSCVVPEAPAASSTEVGGGENAAIGEVLGAATEEPALPAGCSAYLSTYMRKGKKNDTNEVTKLQTFLNETMGANIPVTGYFGSMTRTWVKKFQVENRKAIIQPWYDAGYKGNSLESGTGYVYKTTKYAINLMKCKDLNEPAPDLTSDIMALR